MRNNPTNYVDPSGYFWEILLAIGAFLAQAATYVYIFVGEQLAASIFITANAVGGTAVAFKTPDIPTALSTGPFDVNAAYASAISPTIVNDAVDPSQGVLDHPAGGGRIKGQTPLPVTEREPGFQDELPPTGRGSDGPTPQPVNDGPPDIGTPTPVSPNAGQLKVDYKKGNQKRASKRGQKERKTDVPSFARGEQKLPGETSAEAAERILRANNRPIKKGPGFEFSKLKKYFDANP